MKKLAVLGTMAVVVGLLMAGVAGLFNTGTASVHASRLAGIEAAGATGIQVQNLDASAAANMTAEFYKQDPAVTGAVSLTATGVPAGGSWTIYLPSAPELDNGAYAAIVSADRQIAAIARTDWFSSGGAAIYSNVMPSDSVALPLLTIDYAEQFSLVSIQNTDTGTTATATVEVYAAGAAAPVLNKTYSIGPGKSITINTAMEDDYLGLVSSTPGGFLGSMTVTADVEVGVQSFVDISSSDKAVYAFEGVPAEDAAETLYAPLIRRRHLGIYDTGISVVNPNATDVDVTVTYIGALEACAGTTTTHGPYTIPASSSAVFWQGQGGAGLPTGDNGLPDNCVGSAVISADGGNVLAIVNDSKNLTEESAAYNAVPATMGGTKAALPLARNRFLDAYQFTTGIQVMNIGSSTANVTISYADASGAALTGSCTGCTATIAANGSTTYIPGITTTGPGSMPAGEYGSALVESDGEPIIVIVNDFSFTGNTDAATYNGIKADL